MGVVHELEQERVRLCGKSCMQHCVLDSIQKSHFCSGLCPKLKVSGTSGIPCRYRLNGPKAYIDTKDFNETKGDVGMSRHEKEREQEDTYTKTQSHS